MLFFFWGGGGCKSDLHIADYISAFHQIAYCPDAEAAAFNAYLASQGIWEMEGQQLGLGEAAEHWSGCPS